MAKYTAGPWVRFRDKGKTVAILPAMRPGTVAELSLVTEADACLMAAAPDMLEALKLWGSVVGEGNLNKKALIEALEKTISAILKAEPNK